MTKVEHKNAEFQVVYLNFLVMISFENSPHQSFLSNNVADVRKKPTF